MADKADKAVKTDKTDKADKADKAGKAEPAPKVKGKKFKLWIIISAALVLVAVAGLSLWALGYFKPAAGVEAASKESGKKKKPEVKAILPLEPFLVNLADKESLCYLKATFQLGLEEEDEELKEAASPARVAARDAIISLLSAKSSEQILSTEGKDKLREEIRNRVNGILPHVKVQEVFITDFVVSP